MDMDAVTAKLKAVFERHGVKNALIVDDAIQLEFDDLVDDETWSDFVSAAKQFPSVGKEFTNAGLSLQDKSRKFLLELSQRRSSFDEAIDAVSLLLADFDTKLLPILSLEKMLVACGLDVASKGEVFDVPHDYRCDIAFIDFFLNSSDQPDVGESIDAGFLERNSVVESRKIATEVFQHSKAFIILMSSYPDVESFEDAYQKRSDFLLKGFFKFAPKDSLCDPECIAESLIRLPLDKSLRESVFDFTLAVEDCCKKLASGVASTIRDLTVDDYGYLSYQLIRTESHPLGDYLLRLLGSHLVAQLQAQPSILTAANQLDVTVLKDGLPLLSEPTSALSRLYTEHVCEILPDDGDLGWGCHPFFRTSKGEPKNELADLPFLRFGDLITKDANSTVFLVLSPGCDLMFGPERTDRNADDTVLLLPGELRELHAPTNGSRAPSATTWLVNISDQKRRIEWDFRKFHSISHNSVRKKCISQNYVRKHRIRPNEALHIQQQFLAHLGRVATESPPPIASWHSCNIYCKGIDDKPSLLPEEIPGFIGMHNRPGPKKKGDTISCTDGARRGLVKAVSKWLESELGMLDDMERTDDANKKLSSRRKYLARVLKRVSDWRLEFDLDDPKDFPGGRGSGRNENKKQVKLKDVLVCREFDPSEFQWTAKEDYVAILMLT
tara:strand:+ start:203563 stop:205563 length:2001 start_codon:yes stop_codon:yes gene_type:complete